MSVTFVCENTASSLVPIIYYYSLTRTYDAYEVLFSFAFCKDLRAPSDGSPGTIPRSPDKENKTRTITETWNDHDEWPISCFSFCNVNARRGKRANNEERRREKAREKERD